MHNDSPFTQGREGLIAKLKADAVLAEEVREWVTFGGTLYKRYDYKSLAKPFISVVPTPMDVEQLSNITDQIPQNVEIGCATRGQDPAACETLVYRVLTVLKGANADGMGLTGLRAIQAVSVNFNPLPREEGADLIWMAIVTARLSWLLRLV